MKNTFNDKYIKPQSVIMRITFYIFLILFPLLNSCQEVSTPIEKPDETLTYSTIDDHNIPLFPSAKEQFNYTRSYFQNVHEKRASLKAVCQIYPNARLQCGMASLDLAYSHLGSDHRLAYVKSIEEAIGQYEKIISEFDDVPEVKVKAYWYMGWMYNTLLHNVERGIDLLQTIITNYPGVNMSLASPVPWVSIVYPQEHTSTQPLYSGPQIPWSHLAAIEIIRHSHSDAIALEAFNILMDKNTFHETAGIGLKLLVEREKLSQKLYPILTGYLKTPISNVALRQDLEIAFQKIDTTLIPKGGNL